jgi:hypothetical protein
MEALAAIGSTLPRMTGIAQSKRRDRDTLCKFGWRATKISLVARHVPDASHLQAA